MDPLQTEETVRDYLETQPGIEIDRIFADDNEAFVRYQSTEDSGRRFENTEWLRVEDGEVTEARMYFGSAV